MSKKRAQSPGNTGGGGITRSASFWESLEAYNNTAPSSRADGLKKLGIAALNKDVLGILTKSHFVIPGKTKFMCQQCGACCRYAKKTAQLTYEPCPFLTAQNTCSKHESRYHVCKWFPFWLYTDPRLGQLLTIKPYCSGYGKGDTVDYEETVKRLRQLSLDEKQANDGAFVIHEVLLIPGHKEWAFPSKENIDLLMRYIQEQSGRSAVKTQETAGDERPGEVHYAHHYTSGLLGDINSPLLTVNEKGLMTDVNDAACRLFKRGRDLLIGKALASFFVNKDRAESAVRASFLQGKQTASPHRLCVPDAPAIAVLFNSETYRNRSDGLIHGILVSLSEVSTDVYNEISQSRNYARGLIEASLDAFMVIDKDGTILDVNEAVANITGLPRRSLVGLAFKELFTDKEKAQKGVEISFKNGNVRNFELSVLPAGKPPIPVSFNATVYRNSEGVIQGVFASARDISERLRIIRELEEAKNYARGLIESCIDLMVTIDKNGIITDVNKAAADMTGRPRAEMVGSSFVDYFDDAEKARQGIAITFAKGEVRNYEMNLLPASGKTLPVSFNATIYRNSGGEVQGIFAVARLKA